MKAIFMSMFLYSNEFSCFFFSFWNLVFDAEKNESWDCRILHRYIFKVSYKKKPYDFLIIYRNHFVLGIIC